MDIGELTEKEHEVYNQAIEKFKHETTYIDCIKKKAYIIGNKLLKEYALREVRLYRKYKDRYER